MANNTKQKTLQTIRQRRYLNKEFYGFRTDYVEYARAYYKDSILDMSESSVGGLLVDLAASVADAQSYYLDHQFSELDASTAVETENIEKLLSSAGVDIVGASPAVVSVDFYAEVPATTSAAGTITPLVSAAPVIEAGTFVTADNGTTFELVENVDLSEINAQGLPVSTYRVGQVNVGGTPTTFVLMRSGMCVSGRLETESFRFDGFLPFRRITLSNPHVTSVKSVFDSSGNVYYEVSSLTDDTTYKLIPNKSYDNLEVPACLQMIPAPYRYTQATNLVDRSTTFTFGGGSAETLEDDAVPDPSTFALPLYGKKTFTRNTLNPQRLLNTKTLGVAAVDVDLTVTYRYGGGLSHNVEKGTIRTISSLITTFKNTLSPSVTQAVRSSVSVRNSEKAKGGLDAPDISELKSYVASARNSQSRIVTSQDLAARIYRMPAELGRVFRAASSPSTNNPLATTLSVLCLDADKTLTYATDSLKDNMKLYLNAYRLAPDAIDLVDGSIVNVKILYDINTESTLNKKNVLKQINEKLVKFFDVSNFQINQPLVLIDLENLIFNTPGVAALNFVKVENLTGLVDGREYSHFVHNIKSNTTRGIVVPPKGGMFELKFPDEDVVGRAT